MCGLVCKNRISDIVIPARLSCFLYSCKGGACCLRNIRLCGLLNLSRNARNLVAPYVSPIRTRRLVGALIVARECPFYGGRQLALEERAGVLRNFSQRGDEHGRRKTEGG